MEASGAQWFAIWTDRGHTKQVSASNSSERIDAFLPTMPRWSDGRTARKKSTGRCFPAIVSRSFEAG